MQNSFYIGEEMKKYFYSILIISLIIFLNLFQGLMNSNDVAAQSWKIKESKHFIYHYVESCEYAEVIDEYIEQSEEHYEKSHKITWSFFTSKNKILLLSLEGREKENYWRFEKWSCKHQWERSSFNSSLSPSRGCSRDCSRTWFPSTTLERRIGSLFRMGDGLWRDFSVHYWANKFLKEGELIPIADINS